MESVQELLTLTTAPENFQDLALVLPQGTVYSSHDSVEKLSGALFTNPHAHHIVVIDSLTFGLADCIQAIHELKQIYYHLPIFVCGTLDHNDTVSVLREGAVGTCTKPDWDLLRMLYFYFHNYKKTLKDYAEHAYKTPTVSGFENPLIEQEKKKLNLLITQVSQLPKQASPAPLPNHFFAPPKPKILVIDDYEAVSETYRLNLQATHTVFSANSAIEGLETLEKNPDTDVVILDIEMPGRKGHEIIPNIKAISPNTMILILTAYQDTEIAVKSFESGAADYLNKSASFSDIIEKLGVLIQRKHLKESVSSLLTFPERFEAFTHFAQASLERNAPLSRASYKVFFPESNPPKTEDLWPVLTQSPTLGEAVKATLVSK
ncbi:MAG: response regulator transcription factor [Candidatus Margulisiibacteriota bacterium]